MNRTIKGRSRDDQGRGGAAVLRGTTRYYDDAHDERRAPLRLFLDAYNYARRLKTLRRLTPYEFVCKTWAEQPERFTRDPTHDTVGPNT